MPQISIQLPHLQQSYLGSNICCESAVWRFLALFAGYLLVAIAGLQLGLLVRVVAAVACRVAGYVAAAVAATAAITFALAAIGRMRPLLPGYKVATAAK